MLLEKKFELDDTSKCIIDEFLGFYFPMYYQEATGYDYKQFIHVLMERDPELKPVDGRINSDFYNMGKHLFDEFCKQNNIEYTTILRAAVNSVFHTSKTFAGIHTDHDFPHKIFILYLTNVTNGETLIYDEQEKNIVHTIKPEYLKGVVFSGEPHTILPPGPDERRMVLVVTFI